MRFRATQGKATSLQIGGPLLEAYNYPLVFSPGESWDYGVGIDYAGWMVERVNGGISLEEYLNKNVWGPLGVKSMCFYLKRHPNIMSKITDMSEREGGPNMFGTPANPEGKMRYTDNRIWNMETQGCAGGAGSYGAPRDYQRLLQSILTDDEKLLKRSTVEEMFKPQLNEAGRNGFMNTLKIPEINDAMGGWPLDTKLDWGIGGALVMQDLDGRKKGSMCWSGYPNLIWWIDREGGMAGIFGSQSSLPGDPKTLKFFYDWERTMYERAQKHKL
jgi:CubicO group peptidase (beta-lactamase class C family)